MGAKEAKRSWPAVSHISNLIVREGRLHFCVKKAAGTDSVNYFLKEKPRCSAKRKLTTNGGLLVLLKIIVDEAQHKR
jgi:hypothetical protein